METYAIQKIPELIDCQIQDYAHSIYNNIKYIIIKKVEENKSIRQINGSIELKKDIDISHFVEKLYDNIKNDFHAYYIKLDINECINKIPFDTISKYNIKLTDITDPYRDGKEYLYVAKLYSIKNSQSYWLNTRYSEIDYWNSKLWNIILDSLKKLCEQDKLVIGDPYCARYNNQLPDESKFKMYERIKLPYSRDYIVAKIPFSYTVRM